MNGKQFLAARARVSRLLQRSAVVLTGTIAILGLGMGQEAKAVDQLRMTIPVPALVFYPIYVAQDKGFFAQQDIEMEVIQTQGDGPDVDALIAGSVQFTASTPNRLFTAFEQGKPLKAIMSVSNRMGIHCFISKEAAAENGISADQPLLERFKRLKGLTIGGTRPGAFTYLLAIDYLKRADLVPQDDAKVIGAGGASAMIAAVENRQIDMGCFASPVVELAVSRGKSEWFINNAQGEDPLFGDFLFELLYVRPDYAEENPEIVRRVVKALVDANEWILAASDDEHLEVLKPRFEAVEPEVLMAAIGNVKAAIEPNGCVSPQAVKAAVGFLQRVEMLKNTVPFEAVADNSFLPGPCS